VWFGRSNVIWCCLNAKLVIAHLIVLRQASARTGLTIPPLRSNFIEVLILQLQHRVLCGGQACPVYGSASALQATPVMTELERWRTVGTHRKGQVTHGRPAAAGSLGAPPCKSASIPSKYQSTEHPIRCATCIELEQACTPQDKCCNCISTIKQIKYMLWELPGLLVGVGFATRLGHARKLPSLNTSKHNK
jgi:hypothetical protein